MTSAPRPATPVEISAPRPATPSDPAQVTTPGSLRDRASAQARPARLGHHWARLSAQSVVGNSGYCAYSAAALRAASPNRAVARATVRAKARASAIGARGDSSTIVIGNSATRRDPDIFQRPATPAGSLLFGAPRPRRPRDPANSGGGGLGDEDVVLEVAYHLPPPPSPAAAAAAAAAAALRPQPAPRPPPGVLVTAACGCTRQRASGCTHVCVRVRVRGCACAGARRHLHSRWAPWPNRRSQRKGSHG